MVSVRILRARIFVAGGRVRVCIEGVGLRAGEEGVGWAREVSVILFVAEAGTVRIVVSKSVSCWDWVLARVV